MKTEKGILMPGCEPTEAQLHALMIEGVMEATKKANDSRQKLYENIDRLIKLQKAK